MSQRIETNPSPTVCTATDESQHAPHLNAVADANQQPSYQPQRVSMANISHWGLIAFLLAISTWGLAWRTVQEDEYETTVRLSPAIVSLVQDPSNLNRSAGILKLRNQLGGEVQNLKIHAGCKCTILDEPPKSIANGTEAEIKVKVEDSQAAKQLVLLDFELLRKNASIPVSEVITLVSNLTTNNTKGEQ